MNANLQEVYNDIIKSEMRARLRKEHLTQMKTQISELESRIKELKSEQSSLQGQIVVKVQKVSEEEVNHKWLVQRYKLLEEQRCDLSTRRDAMSKEVEVAVAELNQQRERFCEMAQEFNDGYFVLGNGPMLRKTQAARELQLLKDEEQEYLLEIKRLEDVSCRISGVKKLRSRLQEEVDELEAKCQELDIVLLEENHHLQNVLKEKEAAKDNPNLDPEFKRLQSALQHCLQRKKI